MKATLKLNALLVALMGLVISRAVAQDSIANTLLTVAVTGGSGPFAASGSYKLFTSAMGTNYMVLGRAGAGFNSGTYHYTKTGTNSGVLTFLDSQSGPGISLSLAFTSATTGTLTLTGSTGAQSGAFTATNHIVLSQPDLFLPGFTNGQFQSYLSGREGFVYSIETSTDLATWSAWTNVMTPDLTTNLNVDAAGPRRFIRASSSATAFAPEALTNKTFNLTITDGALPLPTNGICQWLAGTNDNGYQIIGGPGTTNSSGTYSYTRTDPDSGVIAYADSLAGNVSEQLVFTSPRAGYFYATNSAGNESGTFAMADGAQDFLGNIKYVPDTARAGSLYFLADGSPGILSVTNAAGWIWTLAFPTNALITPRTITMTPFASVDSGSALLPVTNGVHLEPDGLQFSGGVTLTVTPPAGLGSHASLMMAGDDGSAIYFVQTTNRAASYSTVLFHFTSGGVTDASDQEWNNFLNHHLPQAQAAYQEAARAVKALERPVVVPPEPPDYDLKCDPSTSASADAQIDAYQKALFAKETDAIQRLLGAARELDLMVDDKSVDDNALSLARELMETAVFRKVDALFRSYSGNPKKMVPVTCIAFFADRQDELLGGPGRPDWMDNVKSWGLRVKTYYFNQLRNEHDYSKMLVLYRVEKQLALVGVDTDHDNFFTAVANAMQFKLTLDIALDATFTDGSGSAHIEASGDVTETADPVSIYPLTGTGTINYQPSYDGAATLSAGQSFPENARVDNLDTCKNMTANIILDRFGADTETYTLAGQDFAYPGLLKGSANPLFSGYLQGGLYSFPVTLQNMNAQAVNQTFIGHGRTGGSVTLKLILTHMPK